MPDSIRENYDRLAVEYTRHLYGELQRKPFDRELLTRFAVATMDGAVCDIGCGPGHVARFLRDTGASVSGIDLSPRMLEQARRLSPDIPFRACDMRTLDLENESLAGITAFYAIVNLPETSLPAVFCEFARVLKPGGLLLLAFHIGDEVLQPTELWGQPVAMSFFFFLPSAIQLQLRACGFEIDQSLEREPYAPEVEHQSRRAYILARKPNGQPSPELH